MIRNGSSRYVRHGELLLGVEGAALLRHVLDGEDEFVARRVAALRRILAEIDGGPLAHGFDVPELSVDDGYSAWAASYDERSNALLRAEEPLVERALAGVAPGRALDAACGTGRHAVRLAGAGHDVVGVDRSPAMLALARAKVPGVEFRLGEVVPLPLDDGSVDLALCALALTHLPDPAPAIAELARVVAPGGRVVLSDAHPTFVLIHGQALFRVDGGLAYVRNHVHLHSTYLRAFAAAGLAVEACEEAAMEPDFSAGLLADAADAAAALWHGIPAVLVWTLERRG